MHRVESIMLHRSSILKMLFRHQAWILFSTYSSILLVGADNAASATNNKCFENRNELKYAIEHVSTEVRVPLVITVPRSKYQQTRLIVNILKQSTDGQ